MESDVTVETSGEVQGILRERGSSGTEECEWKDTGSSGNRDGGEPLSSVVHIAMHKIRWCHLQSIENKV